MHVSHSTAEDDKRNKLNNPGIGNDGLLLTYMISRCYAHTSYFLTN